MELPKNAYFKGKIVPYAEAKVGVLTHAFNYGTAVFAGIRGYWNADEEQLYIFRPIDHFRRFLQSARLMLMEIDHTPESLSRILVDLLRVDGYQCDIYIRPLAYKSDEAIGVRLHNLHDDVTIVALPFEKYIANDTSAHVTISSWRRVDDNTIPARGKVSGAYANSALIKTDAARSGFDDALVLTQEGHVSEGSAMNVFLVRNQELITPPITDNILEGITRRTVIELAQKELGIKVIERPVDRTEIYLSEELFMTGSAAQIVAITKVDHRPIGDGAMGPIAAQLRALFDDAVRGRLPQYRKWNMAVYSEEALPVH
ncbi:MAG: branched-chain amino acid transaminase [Anaerolineales bacterium]|nr:branched-chain amino acid transaminase [Anaerolineales bacterium]